MPNCAGLLGDRRVEVDLQQQVAELLTQVLGVAGVDRLEGLVRLLEQVARQRAVCLLCLPRALGPQSAHHRDELDEPTGITHATTVSVAHWAAVESAYRSLGKTPWSQMYHVMLSGVMGRRSGSWNVLIPSPP